MKDQLTNHPQHTDADYEYLSGKGYTDTEIKAIWDRDLNQGKAPVTVNKYKVDWKKSTPGNIVTK